MSKQSDLVSVSQGASGDPLFIDTVNDRVGIGTSSPVSKLHVAGGTGSTIRNTASAGSSWFVGSNVDAYILHNESNTPMVLTTNGTERMRIDSAGRVTMPFQPYFHASLSNEVNVSSSGQVISFDTVVSNVGSHYNGSTYRFTVPVSGRYFFSVGLRYNYPASSGYTRFSLRKNGSLSAVGLKILDPINTFDEISYQNSSQVVILSCSANDYFDVIEYSQLTGGQLAGSECHFIGYLIG